MGIGVESIVSFLFIYVAQSTYLEFLERTDNAMVMDRCDDCVSDAIDLSNNPVPFGDFYHSVAHVCSNIWFGGFVATVYFSVNMLPCRLHPME